MLNGRSFPKIFVACLWLLSTVSGASGSDESVRALVLGGNFPAVKEIGPAALPELVRLYESADDEAERARLANALYQLGLKSEDARRVLMRDIQTDNADLRLSVQYALGRVSDSPAVIDALLANMQDDTNPLFRDKAACALAYDQIHLTEAQKFRLFSGLVHALRDSKPQVRAIAIQALEIHTGQRKGFSPEASDRMRDAAIADWESWLARYQETLR